MAPARTSDYQLPSLRTRHWAEGRCAELWPEGFGPVDPPTPRVPRTHSLSPPRCSPATSRPPPTQTHPLPRCAPAACAAAPPKVPGPQTRPVLTRRWHCLAEVAPGTRASRGGAGGRAGEGSEERRGRGAPGVGAARLGVPGRPGRAGRRGGRAALTRCCCRVLTAAAAADAALCRSSAACPGLSRLRVNLRVRSTAMAGARICCVRSARAAGLPSAELLSPQPFRKRNSAPFPPSSSPNSLEAGFSLRQPHSPPPALRRSFSTTFQTLRSSRRARPTGRAGPARRRRLCREGRGARVGRPQPTLPAGSAGRPAGAVPATSGTTDDGGGPAAAAAGLRAGPAQGPGPHSEACCRGALATFTALTPAFWGWRMGACGAQLALPPLGRVWWLVSAPPHQPSLRGSFAHSPHSGLWNKFPNACMPSTSIH